MAKESSVGKRIRTYRERLDMSVYDLAVKSGIDEKVINSIEKGRIEIGDDVVVIGGGIMGQLMDDQFKPDPIITRAKDLEAKKVAKEGVNVLGYSSHSLALGKPDRHMDPFRIEFKANGVDEVSSHEGEELIICIAGEVELTYGNDKSVLKPGDTAYYNSVVRHGLRALGGKPASIYGIVFMPF